MITAKLPCFPWADWTNNRAKNKGIEGLIGGAPMLAPSKRAGAHTYISLSHHSTTPWQPSHLIWKTLDNLIHPNRKIRHLVTIQPTIPTFISLIYKFSLLVVWMEGHEDGELRLRIVIQPAGPNVRIHMHTFTHTHTYMHI